jgi:hypothetical protein
MVEITNKKFTLEKPWLIEIEHLITADPLLSREIFYRPIKKNLMTRRQ